MAACSNHLSLCFVACPSAMISRTTGVSHDMPRHDANGSGVGAKCATSSGSSTAGCTPEWVPPS